MQSEIFERNEIAGTDNLLELKASESMYGEAFLKFMG